MSGKPVIPEGTEAPPVPPTLPLEQVERSEDSSSSNAVIDDPNPSAPVLDAEEPVEPLQASASNSSTANATANGSGNPLEKLILKMNNLATSGKWTEIATVVRQSEDNMVKRCGDLEQFILACDPQKHTAAIIMAIAMIYDIAEKKKIAQTQERAFDILKHYLDEGSLDRDQAFTVIDIYCGLFRRLYDYSIAKQEPIAAIPIVIAGIKFIAPQSSSTLTSLHGHLFSLCVRCQDPATFEVAREYLNEDIGEIINENMAPTTGPAILNSSGQPHIDPKYVLQYLYYGSVILFNCGEWRKSSLLLYNAVVFPANATSALQMQAYKRWMIVQLLQDVDPVHPAGRSPCIVRSWKELGEPYNKLARVIRETVGDRAEAVINLLDNVKTKKIFEKDGHLDLIERLVGTLRERALLKVAKCFSTLSLPDLIRRAYLQDETAAIELCTRLESGGKLLVHIENGVAHLDIPKTEITHDKVASTLKKLNSMMSDMDRVHSSVQSSSIFLSRTLRPTMSLHHMAPMVGGGFLDDEGLSMSAGGSSDRSFAKE